MAASYDQITHIFLHIVYIAFGNIIVKFKKKLSRTPVVKPVLILNLGKLSMLKLQKNIIMAAYYGQIMQIFLHIVYIAFGNIIVKLKKNWAALREDL